MRRLVIALCLVAPWPAAGCGPAAAGGPSGPARSPTGPVRPVEVSDAAFGRSVHQLLLDGSPAEERTNLLVGVVRRQLQRARSRFASGHTDSGLASVTGAMYLVRARELRPEMFDGAADPLRQAAREVARIGDEGHALALYTMLRGALPAGPARKDVDVHLRALARWTAATRPPGSMQAIGADQRSTAHRSLFESTEGALNAARDTALSWIERSLEFDTEQMPPRSHYEREEAVEAFRARRAGGATLVALYLRHGDPAGALDAIERDDVSRVVPPPLQERIEHLADNPTAEVWWQIYQLFSRADSPEPSETALDPELARAAAWGACVELYRMEPNSLRSALALAELLARYQMPEAVPLVLHGAIGNDASARDLSLALGLTLRAVVEQDEIGEIGSARRTFDGAAPVVALAEAPTMAGRTRPTAARARYIMGAIEMRAGELERAKAHIAAAVRSEPSAESYLRLAAIDRQRGDTEEALGSLANVGALARASNDVTTETEALLLSYEVHRDAGAGRQAEASLQEALRRALDGRTLARSTAERARAERLLARALESYGDLEGARRATERAYEAAGADVRQITATILEQSRRSLTRGDLTGGRAAVRRALDADLESDDMVYVALWLLLLEESMGVPDEGDVREALATVDERSGWSATLRAWAERRLDDTALNAAAHNRVERTEAKFYVGMDRRARGDREKARKLLEDVARSEAVDLVEVRIARDLLALDTQKVVPRIPADLAIP